METDARVCDEIDLIPTIGHTPGHVSVRIRSRGEEALITGDFMHHPCQIAHPEWASTADSDPEMGQRTRERMFEALAGAPVLVIGTHFAGATAGRIVRDGAHVPVGCVRQASKQGVHTEVTQKGKTTENHRDDICGFVRSAKYASQWLSVASPFSVTSV